MEPKIFTNKEILERAKAEASNDLALEEHRAKFLERKRLRDNLKMGGGSPLIAQIGQSQAKIRIHKEWLAYLEEELKG